MVAIQDTIIDDLKMQLSRLQNDDPNIVTYQEIVRSSEQA